MLGAQNKGASDRAFFNGKIKGKTEKLKSKNKTINDSVCSRKVPTLLRHCSGTAGFEACHAGANLDAALQFGQYVLCVVVGVHRCATRESLRDCALEEEDAHDILLGSREGNSQAQGLVGALGAI